MASAEYMRRFWGELRAVSPEVAELVYRIASIAGFAGAFVALASLGTILFISPLRTANLVNAGSMISPVEAEASISSSPPSSSDRRLTNDQRDLIQRTIGDKGPSIHLRIQRAGNDREASAFANEIIAELSTANVDFDVADYRAIDPPLYGIALVHAPDNFQWGDIVAHALERAGFPVMILVQQGMTRVQLVIGQNPELRSPQNPQ